MAATSDLNSALSSSLGAASAASSWRTSSWALLILSGAAPRPVDAGGRLVVALS